MLFWGITGTTIALAILLLIRAAQRASAQGVSPADYDLRVYQDQLKEIERDVARGVLGRDDAERVRVEISRRILAAADIDQSETDNDKSGPLALAGIALIIISGAFGLYLKLGAPGYGDLALSDRIAMAEEFRAERPDQAAAEKGLPKTTPIDPNPDYEALVVRLRETILERPDDLRGYRLLTRAEAQLGNFTDAHIAQARVIELTGGPEADVRDWSDYADLLVLAAGGYVSPEAEEVLSLILGKDAQNPTARYYWGLMMRQTGRPDRAFRIWDALLRESPSGAPWVPPITAQISEVALMAGVTGYQAPTPTATRGPSASDIESAQEMSPAERMEMIEGMVGGLADRLGDEGGPPEDWARLISALGVLGRYDQARAIFDNALEVFADNPGALDVVNRAADRAGLL